MLRLSRDQVITVIEPHSEQLYRVGSEPFARYIQEYPNLALHSPRTRANIVWDLMIDQVQREFRGVRNTEIIMRPSGIVLLAIADKVCFRCKKLDEDGLPSNYPTSAALSWDRDEDLPGIPSALERLSLGYKLNNLQTAVRAVQITSTFYGRYQYGITLEEPSEGLLLMDNRGRDSGGGAASAARNQRRVFIRPTEEQTEMG